MRNRRRRRRRRRRRKMIWRRSSLSRFMLATLVNADAMAMTTTTATFFATAMTVVKPVKTWIDKESFHLSWKSKFILLKCVKLC